MADRSHFLIRSGRGRGSSWIDVGTYLFLMGCLSWLLVRGSHGLGYHWHWYRVPVYLLRTEGTAIHPGPLTLDFNTLQIGALILTIILAWKTTDDGYTNYFEGLSHLIFFVCYAIITAFM